MSHFATLGCPKTGFLSWSARPELCLNKALAQRQQQQEEGQQEEEGGVGQFSAKKNEVNRLLHLLRRQSR
jgi:hypothetical protein